MKQETLRLMIELDPRKQPISGQMLNETGQIHPFTGWLGLAAALGAALNAGTPQVEDEPESR
jgi:hypothetical protein